MPELRSDEIARRLGADAVGAVAGARYLTADSRAANAETAFAAVRGGSAFVGDALARGAPFVIVEDAGAVPHGASAVVVHDCVGALMSIARSAREEASYEVVAITGSTGKTLTKDLVAAALGPLYEVHATPRSFNAEIGVPLTVLACPDRTRVLVAELAARRRGEIAELCGIVRPGIGVITGIGTAHLGVFGSRETIARTKAELLASLPADGTAIVPSDDDFLHVLAASTAARVATVGPGGAVGYRAERIDPDGRTFGRVRVGDSEVDVVLPVPGRALMRNAALALTVARELGVDVRAAAAGLAGAVLSEWRLQTERIGEMTVVNDAWNSNPTSLAVALRSVRELAGAREPWAVLGHMAELGSASEREHVRAGRLAAALGYRGVICVGAEAAGIAEGAGPIAHRVGSLPEAATALRELAAADAVVVVKASRVAGLERIVEALRTTSKVG